MFCSKLFIAAFLLIGANARHLQWETEPYREEEYTYPEYHEDKALEYQQPGSLRFRRQAQGSVKFNSDGSTGLNAKIPLVGNDKNILSAIGSVDLNNQMHTSSKGFGLALDNVNGHSASVMKETIPGFGDKLTGAGHATLFHNNNHDVGANAFISRNIPTIPNVPNFNTVGGGLDYTYKNKIGASLGMAHTPYLNRNDYSAMGNLNLYRSRTSSADFNAGFKRFYTPFMSSGWKPNFGLSFSRSF